MINNHSHAVCVNPAGAALVQILFLAEYVALHSHPFVARDNAFNTFKPTRGVPGCITP